VALLLLYYCYFSIATLLLHLRHSGREEQRLPLLNEVWKVVAKSDKIGSYVRCCSAWLDMVVRHYTEKEMLVLLGDLASKLQARMAAGEQLSEATLRHLENLLANLLSNKNSFGAAVLTSDHLLKILDVFKGSKKVGLSKVSFIFLVCFLLCSFFPFLYLGNLYLNRHRF
jgi:hypothetical protein